MTREQVAHALQNAEGMALYCDFSGSYYDPEPWTHQACAVDVAVPEGCPIHLVTGAQINPAYVMAQRVTSNGVATDTPSTLTSVGADHESFWVMEVNSCDCHFTTVAVTFEHLEIDVPGAVAGETVRLWGLLQGNGYEVQITAPGPCPTPEWPTEYSAALACDRCPEPDNDGDGIPDDIDTHDDNAGCAVGGDPSVILVGLALVPFMRRRRAKILSSE